MIQITLETFRLLFYLNGGAAVALLAYLGNIAAKTACTTPTPAPDVHIAMAWFCGGLFTCVLAFGTSYATQHVLFIQDPNHPSKAYMIWVWPTVVLGILSLAAFSAGALYAAKHLLRSS